MRMSLRRYREFLTWTSRLLSLLKVELLMGIVELQGESSNLLLKKTNHGLVLSHNSLKCADLALHLIKLGMEINNELISGVNHLMVGLS